MNQRKTNRYFISSWSGGKDSCLAFYYAIQAGLTPICLLNMLLKTPMAFLKKRYVCEQAKSINADIIVKETVWNQYETDYVDTLKKITSKADVDFCVFGDIDIEEHKHWNEKICKATLIKPWIPLWQKKRRTLMRELISLGFKVLIVVVDTRYLSPSFLGKELDLSLISALEKEGVDICGETGEYHTIVTGGPIFAYPIKIQKKEIIKDNFYYHLLIDF